MPLNTLLDLKTKLDAHASAKGGTRYECKDEARSNFLYFRGLARDGTCTWTQSYVKCVVQRRDPNPDPSQPQFPHRCPHYGLLIEARSGTTISCFILDDTVLQWELPYRASHADPMLRGTDWNDYFTRLRQNDAPLPVMSSSAPPAAPAAAARPRTAAHILVEAPNREAALLAWARELKKHYFVIAAIEMKVLRDDEAWEVG